MMQCVVVIDDVDDDDDVEMHAKGRGISTEFQGWAFPICDQL